MGVARRNSFQVSYPTEEQKLERTENQTGRSRKKVGKKKSMIWKIVNKSKNSWSEASVTKSLPALWSWSRRINPFLHCEVPPLYNSIANSELPPLHFSLVIPKRPLLLLLLYFFIWVEYRLVVFSYLDTIINKIKNSQKDLVILLNKKDFPLSFYLNLD
jgi:hypothetical protein